MSTNFFKNLKTKLLTLALTLCLIVSCTLGLIACGKDDNVVEQDPTYTFSQNTTTETTNENNFNFSEGLNLETDTFPSSSTTSWSLSVDNSAVSSSVKSGVVNVSEEGWKKVVSALSDDREFLDYVKRENDVSTDDDAKALIGKDKYFVAPKRDGATDNYVYMLNNYREKIYKGVGTAQKVSSSVTLTLDKNSNYKIGVWVNTQKLATGNPDGLGASIRLVNTFNGTSQADYAIDNINTNGEWKQYFIYVKSDEFYSCSLSIVLGLGYGNGASNLTKDYVEGTVYFDDVTYEKIDAIPDSVKTNELTTNLDCSIEKRRSVLNKENTLYNMVFDTTRDKFFDGGAPTYTTSSDLFTTALGDETVTSQTICGKDKNDEDISKISTNAITDGIEINLTKASATYTLPVSATLNSGEYAIVNFRIKNGLNSFGSTDITIDVWDEYDGVKTKRPAVTTFSTPSEDFVNCTLYIKNNFENADNRTFSIDVVMGPTKVAEVERANDFASGVVTIANLRCKVGNIESDKDDIVAKFFTSSPSATVSLYAGYDADFSEEANNDYSISEAPGSIGMITSYPSNPSGYDGIVANHAYIVNDKNAETAINTRSGKDGTAGLINSDNIDGTIYNGITLENLGLTSDDKAIQPLMINNKVSDSYGFIAKKATTIEAGAIASFSVKVRVLGDAKAYIYLVNADKSVKDVVAFEDFTTNTDVVKGVKSGDQIKGSEKLFAVEVTKDMCNEDGWATVSFFIVNGKNEKQVRLELWNGSRNADVKSQGIVFFDEVAVKNSSAFTKSEKWNETFSVSGNPLYDQTFASYDNGELFAFKRNLTQDEVNFNAEYPDKAVEYFTTYVWAKNDLSVYADYSTLDSTKVIVNPYDSIEEKEEEAGAGCVAKTDPSTFWLSFSTIILIVALVLAFIALIIKKIIRKRKANASDAKSHFKVTSRIKKKVPETKPKNEVKEETTVEVETDTKDVETKEDETTDTVSETENVETNDTEDTETDNTEKNTEETDGYVYGDVIEDFTIENPETETTETTAPSTPNDAEDENK